MNPPRASTLLRALRARVERDEGFTLVEMMVALGVILVSVFSLAYTATVGFSDVALARQRQGANGIANKLLEQVRALPFHTVSNGLANSDLAAGTDANITTSGCGESATYCFRGEEIPRGDNVNAEPLVPHRATVTVGQTTYTRGVYVTHYENDRSTNAFRVTVLVTWANPARRGVRSTVEAQSVLFSPGSSSPAHGCVSDATHPFAAPCQTFFYGGAQRTPGSIEITGTVQSVAFEKGTLSLGGQSSNTQVEQIAKVQGDAETSGVVLKAGGTQQTAGGTRVTSLADNDPSGADEYDSQSAGSTTSSTLTASGGDNSISFTSSGGDVATTTSTTSASSTNVCAAELDMQPCGRSFASQGSDMQASLSLGTGGLGVATLASVGPSPTGSTAFTHREQVAGADGFVHAETSRALGEIRLAALPAGLDVTAVPLGWQGYLVRVTGFTDRVTAQAGTNTVAPTASVGGTVEVWNGLGYTTIDLTTASNGIAVTPVHIEDLLLGGSLLTIDISAELRTGGASTSSTAKDCAPASCPDTRTKAAAASGSPLLGDVRYRVVLANDVLADMKMTVDLGSIQTWASYTEAPTSG